MDEIDGTLNSDPNPSHGSSGDTPGAPAPSDEGQNSQTDKGAKTPTLSDALDKVQLEEPAGDAGGEGIDEGETPALDGNADENGADDEAAAGNDEKAGDKSAAASSLNQRWDKSEEWGGLLKLLTPEQKPEAIKKIRPVFERAAALAVQVEKAAPLVAIAREFRECAGDEEGFRSMQVLARSYGPDPETALPIVEKMLEDLRARSGRVITSGDLKQRLAEIDTAVEQQQITAEFAEQWKADLLEAEKARAGGRNTQATLKQTQAQQAARAQQAAIAERTAKLDAWEAAKRSSDPAYGDITAEDDPMHGRSVADKVFDAITLLQVRKPNATNAELLAEADRVYRLARGQLKTGKPVSQRVITAENSSLTTKRKPKSLQEALDQVVLE